MLLWIDFLIKLIELQKLRCTLSLCGYTPHICFIYSKCWLLCQVCDPEHGRNLSLHGTIKMTQEDNNSEFPGRQQISLHLLVLLPLGLHRNTPCFTVWGFSVYGEICLLPWKGRTIPTACELLWTGTGYESCTILGWVLKKREQSIPESRVSLLWREIPHQWAPLVLVIWVSTSVALKKSYKKASLSMALVRVTLYTDLLWLIGIRTSGLLEPKVPSS